jgi:prevent-host-death family protein
MKEIAISEFKAKCLAILDEVSKTKKPIRIVRRGKAVADVIPATVRDDEKNWLGFMKGTAEITGDIISPATDPEEWEVLRD